MANKRKIFLKVLRISFERLQIPRVKIQDSRDGLRTREHGLQRDLLRDGSLGLSFVDRRPHKTHSLLIYRRLLQSPLNTCSQIQFTRSEHERVLLFYVTPSDVTVHHTNALWQRFVGCDYQGMCCIDGTTSGAHFKNKYELMDRIRFPNDFSVLDFLWCGFLAIAFNVLNAILRRREYILSLGDNKITI